MAATNVTLYGAKDGFISGDFGTTEALHSFADSINQAYSKLVSQALSTLTKNIQSAARADPQWAPYASKIIAAYEDGEFMYTFVGTDVDPSVFDTLEFGDRYTPPAPILRKTLLHDLPEITKMLEIELV